MKYFYLMLLMLMFGFDGTAQQQPQSEQFAQSELAQPQAVYYQQAPQYAPPSLPDSKQTGVVEYGLLGILTIGIFRMLWMSVKADKESNKIMAKAVDKLGDAVKEFHSSNLMIFQEIKGSNKEIKQDLGEVKNHLVRLDQRIESVLGN